MSDPTLVRVQLLHVRDALATIQRRMEGIEKPMDFWASEDARIRLDSIAMLLLALGEAVKKIDKNTDGKLMAQYPQIDWRGVKGIRDVLAHDYFDLNILIIFQVCRERLPELTGVVDQMLEKDYKA